MTGGERRSSRGSCCCHGSWCCSRGAAGGPAGMRGGVLPAAGDLVVTDPSGVLAEGTKVVTIMGGLGRSRNGSYAEYTTAPAANVASIETSLDWTDLVAIPARVSRRAPALTGRGSVVIENGNIAGKVHELAPGGVDRVLDLVGNSVLRDSLQAVRAKGRVCQAGFLGGLGAVPDFLPIVDMPSGVQFSFSEAS